MRLSGRPLLPQIVWHVLAILILVSVPLLKWKAPWWELSREHLLPIIALIAAYATAAFAVTIFARAGTPRAFARGLALALSIFGVFVVGILLLGLDTPRYLLLPVFLAVMLLAPLAVAPRLGQLAGVGVLAVGLLAVAGLGTRATFAETQKTTKVVDSTITTAFYVLRVRSHEGEIPQPATRGGGLDRLGDALLLATGDGHLYTVRLAGDDLQARELPTRVPANREEFAAAIGGSAEAPRLASAYGLHADGIQTWRFRVADVMTQVVGDAVHIFASHHFWKAREQCFVVRVSQLDARLSDLQRGAAAGSWQTIYESQPCLPMSGPNAMHGKNPFRGEEIGGRMALLDAQTLLLTLGDHGFSGIESAVAYPQDPRASYGKTLRIDLRTHAASLHTLGHRNPQGLLVAPDGRVWETEHAAQGGDELNLLEPGANYGWPQVTYGTDYGALIWPLSRQQGRHASFRQPVYSWLPGIGVSNLVQIQRDRFPVWRGDLLIGSLGARTLFRVVLDGNRAVLAEPIALEQRVRDILELDDGRLLLWTDEGALVTVEPASGSDAAVEFATGCSGCHRINDGRSHRMGPDLYGLMDREIASAENFAVYTPALQGLGGTWSEERLDAFLRDPQAVAPGTSMVFPGVADDRQRARIVDYVIATSKVGGQ
ncbi:MAG TPA: PQQ-dependent sugar dehydrogenase [Steroidobacteraceae bacterium]|nr:PQQ-dependent sugar dehydrogenase [Steroidobacteraceae bacterium]